jgi:hypothetical protein
VPGKIGFIYCLWPGAGAAWGPHKFPEPDPFSPHPQGRLHPKGDGGGGVYLPQAPHQTLGGALQWFTGGMEEERW